MLPVSIAIATNANITGEIAAEAEEETVPVDSDGSGDVTAPADTGDPGTGDPGAGDPGATDPGTTDPGTTDPGTTDPGTTDPGATDPGATDPGATDPGVTDSGATDPETTDSGATDPGTTEITDPALQPADGAGADTAAPTQPVGAAAGIMALDAPIMNYAAEIDLSKTTTSGTGYTVSGNMAALANSVTNPVTNPDRILTFTTAANGLVYHIIQSTVLANPADPNAPKNGTSIYREISIPDGVNVTLVIDNIDMYMTMDGIILSGSGKLNLLLSGNNYVRGFIRVLSTNTLTIDSLNGDNVNDKLTIPVATSASNTFASIGGSQGQTPGPITINGGSVNITARSTGAGIGGGGSTGSVAGDGGTITINGGKVSVTQYGLGTATGGGAGIGGGGQTVQSTNNSGGTGGTIKINGGTVTVRQNSAGAGIGGGAYNQGGDITISDGTVDAEVYGAGVINSSGGASAAIGAGSGSSATLSGYTNITIIGGTVRAVSPYVGIGRMHPTQNYPCTIIISGGTIYAQGGSGPGIGTWSSPYGSVIKITGGTIVAQSSTGAAIGGPQTGTLTPILSTTASTDAFMIFFTLDAAANVIAYSGSTNLPAINTGANQGNGYYVNAGFASGTVSASTPVGTAAAVSATAATKLNVYAGGDGGALVKTLTLPATYTKFAYSSDQAAARTDAILAYNSSTSQYLGAVVRLKDSNTGIFSIKSLTDYNAYNNNANYPLLPVKVSAAASNIVTEKYVDNYGNQITGQNDTSTLVLNGAYSKTLPVVSGYTPAGYKTGSAPGASGMDYTPGDPSNVPISGATTVYLVYKVTVSTTNVTVSKTITGDFADTTRSFAFTAYFTDSAGKALSEGTSFDYKGGVIPVAAPGTPVAPADGTLTLDTNGQAGFKLAQGQSITITNVPVDAQIEIVETANQNYRTSFTDSADANNASVNNNDTGLSPVGAADRTFDFVNARITIVPTGISLEGAPAPLLLAALLLVGGLAAIGFIRRRICAK